MLDEDGVPRFSTIMMWRGFPLPWVLWCCVARPRPIKFSSRRFSDIHVVGLVRTGLDRRGIRACLLGYPPTYDAWYYGY